MKNNTKIKMHNKIFVRRAKIGDEENLAKLFIQTWYNELDGITPKNFKNRFNYHRRYEKFKERIIDPKWIIYIAEINNEVVGMVCLGPYEYDPKDFKVAIRGMYVDSKYHRRGIGRSLFNKMLKNVKEKNYKKLILWCIDKNKKAKFFYKAMGGHLQTNYSTPECYSEMKHVAFIWSTK